MKGIVNKKRNIWYFLAVIPVALLAVICFCYHDISSAIACVALIVSMTSMILAQQNVQRNIEEQTKHNIISQRPLLQAYYNWDTDGVSLSINNGGLGLAKIISFCILENENEGHYKNCLELADKLLEGADLPIPQDTLFGTTPDDLVLLPGDNSVLLEISYPHQWHNKHMLELVELFKGYSFKIEYIDVYDLDTSEKEGIKSVQRLFCLKEPILIASPEMLPREEKMNKKKAF